MEEKTEKIEQPEEVVVKVPLQDEVPETKKSKKPWLIPVLCSIWFLATICNMYAVEVLLINSNFPAMSTMMVQLASISLYSWIFTIYWGVPENKKQVSRMTYVKLIFPVAISILMRTSTRMDPYAQWTTPISDPFSLCVEAFYPLCVLVFARHLLGEEEKDNYGFKILVAGLFGLCVNGFNSYYRDCIMLSENITIALITAFEVVYSKMTMKETGIHPMRLLSVLSATVLLIFLPLWLQNVYHRVHRLSMLSIEDASILIFGACSWAQTAAAFGLLSMLPIHHFLIGNGCNRIIRMSTAALVTYARWNWL